MMRINNAFTDILQQASMMYNPNKRISQQVSDAPTGLTKSLKVTVTTADASLSAAQRLVVNHGFEGLNMADLNWGTSVAKSLTLSFWVKSSVTGT